VKRNRAITGAAVAVVLALTAGTTVSYLKYRDAERQRSYAEEGQREAEKRRKEADEERQTALAVSEFLGGLFEDVDPVARTGRAFGAQKRGEKALTAVEVVDRGARKLKTALRDKPRVRAALLDRIGTVYLDLERAREAEPLLQEALQIRLAEYGPDSLEAAASRQSIGLLHMCRSEGEPARAALEQALSLRRQHLGNDHPLVADTLFHLGIICASLEDLPTAEASLRECLAIRRRHFGSESREVGAALFVMGEMYLHFGDAVKALAPLQEAAALADKLEGKNDFYTVISLFSQAQLAEKLGNAGRARTLYQEAEAKGVKLLGADHHLVALGRTEVAYFLFRQDEHEEGVKILREVIAILRKSFGPDSYPVAARLLILARAERQLEHFKEAETAAGEAVRIWRKSLAGKTPRPLNAAECLHVQAGLVLNRGAGAEADPLYREGLAILLREKVPSFAERQHSMARVLALVLLTRAGIPVSQEFIDHTQPSGEKARDLAFAETWARASQALLRFSQPPTADDLLIGDYFQSKAILMLRSAVAAGLRDVDVIQSNAAFESLHGRADFQEIVQNRRR
jgi:tetratricopeptide (TPR) repeat protein